VGDELLDRATQRFGFSGDHPLAPGDRVEILSPMLRNHLVAVGARTWGSLLGLL